MTRHKYHIYSYLLKAKKMMDHHFYQKITLNQLAAEAHLSRFHFARQFKIVYRVTPGHYLTMKRIEQAKLLLEKGYPTRQVCFDVGYESPTSFNILFKRHTFLTPRQYQRIHEHRKGHMDRYPMRWIPHCLVKKREFMLESAK